MWKTVEARDTGIDLPGASLLGQLPLAEIIILVVAMACAAIALRNLFQRRRSKSSSGKSAYTSRYPRKRSSYSSAFNAIQARKKKSAQPARPALHDPVQQLAVINRAKFQKVRLLNKEEARILPIVENYCRELGQGHRVMAQTSLGELLRTTADKKTDADAAFACINSKRLDIAIIDRGGFIAAAIEYQGSGHFQNGAFMRDAVKREALRRAGITMIEIMPDDSAPYIRQQIARQIGSAVDLPEIA